MVAGEKRRDDILGAELLLPMWQPGGHTGGRRRAQVHVVSSLVGVRCLGLRSSLQFDPAPRAGEPLVSRRPPDYVSRVDGLSDS